jgi:single-strand DNA-binding protein
MKSVNKVILVGNVIRDPELKTTSSGLHVCTFSLATTRTWKDEKGETRTLPEYHSVVAWNGLAEVCGQHVKKGKPLYIEGYLKTRSWDNDQKQRMQRTEVVVEELILLASSVQAE